MNNRGLLCSGKKQIEYDGIEWNKDSSDRYHGNRCSLHRYIWENFMETGVPDGCVIHHLDQNPLNNTIENLVCVTHSEHSRWHASHRSAEHRKKLSEANKGKEFSAETRKKLSEALKGHERSAETRKKMSAAKTKYSEGDVWSVKSGWYKKENGIIRRVKKFEYEEHNI